MFAAMLPYDVAHLITGDFMNYYHQFRSITKRVRARFEHRDWQGSQKDARRRTTLYTEFSTGTSEKIRNLIGHKIEDSLFWAQVKAHFEEDILNMNVNNIAQTYYNSVFRLTHPGLSTDPRLMFVQPMADSVEFKHVRPIFKTYSGYERSAKSIVAEMLQDFKFNAPFEDLDRDLHRLTDKIHRVLLSQYQPDEDTRLEVLKPVFFRNKGAYLVGRAYIGGRYHPFVVSFLHEEKGVFVDALLLDEWDIKATFSYNHAYFFVDVDIPSEVVSFLETIVSGKKRSELYNCLGLEKHGKTEFYRDFLRYIQTSTEVFVPAPGIKGMVMAVFTLPSYDMVFKVIRDKFSSSKNMTEADVRSKYSLVNQYDRVGRMADPHVFEEFTVHRSRISEEVLKELLDTAPSKVAFEGENVIIKHLYVEKKMIPLNIYLEQANTEDAEHALDQYGLAIKELAGMNIFPGDLLIKNFGVTPLKRVVFYDYDEIGFLTDYHFRKIPQARYMDEEFMDGPWFSVGPNDIFPEEFRLFLVVKLDQRKRFEELHGDLFEPVFWQNCQAAIQRGEVITVFPYRISERFARSA